MLNFATDHSPLRGLGPDSGSLVVSSLPVLFFMPLLVFWGATKQVFHHNVSVTRSVLGWYENRLKVHQRKTNDEGHNARCQFSLVNNR